MPARFAAIEASASVAVDHLYGEACRSQPMREMINGAPVFDMDRAVETFTGVFDAPAVRTEMSARTERPMAGRITAKVVLSVADLELPRGLRRIDRIIRDEPGTAYEVRGVRPDGVGRTDLDLVEVEP